MLFCVKVFGEWSLHPGSVQSDLNCDGVQTVQRAERCVSVSVSPLSSHLSAAKVHQHALPWLSLSQAQSSRLAKVPAISEISGVSGQLQDQQWVQVQGSDLHQWDHHLAGALWQEIYRLLHLSVWKVGSLSFSTVVLAASQTHNLWVILVTVLDGFVDIYKRHEVAHNTR